MLQYGTSPYLPTASASGVLSDSTSGFGFAKLSDAAINALEDGDDTYDYFMLTSETATSSAAGTSAGTYERSSIFILRPLSFINHIRPPT